MSNWSDKYKKPKKSRRRRRGRKGFPFKFGPRGIWRLFGL